MLFRSGKILICTLSLFALLLSPALAKQLPPNTAVDISSVTDSRTTGDFFKYFRVELEVKPKQIAQTAVGATKLVITEAKSNLGASLLQQNRSSDDPLFQALQPLKDSDTLKIMEDLKNPARNATSVRIKGFFDVYAPAGRPHEKLVIKDYQSMSSKPLTHKALKDRGITVTYFTKDDWLDHQEKVKEARKNARKNKTNEKDAIAAAMGDAFADMFSEAFGFMSGSMDMTFVVTDLKNQIAKIELYNEKGQLMETQSRSWGKYTKKNAKHSVGYKRSLPHKGRLVFHFADSENLHRVPVDLTVDLP